ncbi:MAG TPA: DUF4873 domain-containing protein [Jatrophihabitantaceae bacterium]|jgi:hypothetical protein|nr:DUF4873 domain-containing protein [Jatrophihabitantaceae bacterium]
MIDQQAAGSAAADGMDQLADDGYAGPAELVDGEAVVPVTVNLRGRFDPISGSYHWYGRVAATPAVTELVAVSGRTVLLRTPHGEVATGLADVDPWGRPRVEGFGVPPFAVVTEIPAEEG